MTGTLWVNSNVPFILQATFLTVIVWIRSPNLSLQLRPFPSAVISGDGRIGILGVEASFFPSILPSQKFDMYKEVESYSLVFMNFNYILNKCMNNKLNLTFIRLSRSKIESVNYLIPVWKSKHMYIFSP